MKLKNKKTGEIVEVESLGHADSLKKKFGYQVTLSWKVDEHLNTCKTYDSLAELNAEWEDYEEPKEYYCIDWTEPNGIYRTNYVDTRDDFNKEIGNLFESKEDAERAVEKLKAWKRLKDKGFKFAGWGCENQKLYAKIQFNKKAWATETEPDLDLLFGGEE